MKILEWLGKQSEWFWVLVGFGLTVVLGALDYLAGYELSFALFYLVPITLVTWYAGRIAGFTLAIAGTLAWIAADIASGHPHSSDLVPVWNSIFSLLSYSIVVLLISALRDALEEVKALATHDSLTGAFNGRVFSGMVARELERCKRYGCAFSVAYMDIDNFKAVNDQFGHSMGDEVLCSIVDLARSKLRSVDVIARLGGDEFAFLLPETNPQAAQEAVQRVHSSLMEDMRSRELPVTFSIGVLTCMQPSMTSDEVISLSDQLMYTVKNQGKNSVSYDIISG